MTTLIKGIKSRGSWSRYKTKTGIITQKSFTVFDRHTNTHKIPHTKHNAEVYIQYVLVHM